MNFGNWIVVAFVMFAVFIGALVTVCVRQDINLVSKEYYKEELNYPDQMRRLTNANQLAEKPSITNVNGSIKVAFAQAVDKGELTLFCPSDPAMDRKFQIDSNVQQQFDAAELTGKMYRARLFWTSGDTEYLMEQVIFI